MSSRSEKLKLRTLSIDVEEAVAQYRATGQALAQLQRKEARRTAASLRLIGQGISASNEIELALVLAGLDELVLHLREERKIVEALQRVNFAEGHRSAAERRLSLIRRVIDGRVAEATLEFF